MTSAPLIFKTQNRPQIFIASGILEPTRVRDTGPMTRTAKADTTPLPAWATAESAIDRARTSFAPAVGDHAFLTVAEAASLLRVSEKTIRRQIAGGRLPACRVGRSVRLSTKAVEMLIYSGDEGA